MLVLVAILGYYTLLFKKFLAVEAKHRVKATWIKIKNRTHGKIGRHASAIIGAVILMFYFAYIYCTKTALEVFACETKESGRSTMVFEPKIDCSDADSPHSWMWPLALLFSGLYGVGIPIGFFAIVYKNRYYIKGDQMLRVLGIGGKRDDNPAFYDFRKRYHKLYYRFKPKYYYWTSVILLRKFLIVLCTVFLYHNPTLQATCALMVLVSRWGCLRLGV